MTHRLVGAIVVIMAGLMAMPLQAATKGWNDGTDNWSNPAAWTPTGVPQAGDTVNIVFADDVARTVTYDYTGPPITLGQLTTDLTVVGTNSATLTMSANVLTTTGEQIGQDGRGIFNQSGGTHTVNTSDLAIGTNAGAVGTYNLSGSGTLVAANENVGFNGIGNIVQSGGSNTISGAGHALGLGTGAGTGNYTLTGGSLSGGDHEYVGFFGTGNFNHSGGTNVVPGVLHVGTYATSIGTYTLSGGGQLTVNGQTNVGEYGNGTITQIAGTSVLDGFAGLVVGSTSGALGLYSLSGGSLDVPSNEFVGYFATGNGLQSGGTFTQTGGTHRTGNLLLANYADSTGMFTLSAGSLVSSNSESIGYGGTGVFQQDGGTHTSTGDINIGYNAGSSGSYALNGGAANAANIYVGGNASGAGGAGTMAVSGSNTILTVPGTIKVYTTTNSGFSLQSGTANVGAINVNGVPSRFSWSSGTLNITNDLALDSGAAPTSTSAAFGSSLSLSSRVLKVTGNETIGGNGAFALSLNSISSNAAVHSVTGTITLKPGGSISANGGNLTYANFIQAGGTISGQSFRNASNFTYQSGSFTGTLINDGTISFGPTFSVAALQNETSMTVSNGQVLSTTNSNGISNSGTFTVNAGSLSTSTFTNTGTATFTAGGFTGSNPTITNSGNFVVNGGSIPGGNFTNSGTFVLNGGALSVSTFTNTVSGAVTAHGTFSGLFVNHGTFTMDGPFTFNNSFSVTQDGILQGVGNISNVGSSVSITNSAGGVINSTTPNGALNITNFLTNNGGAIVNVGPTSTLSLSNNGGSGGWTNSGIVNMQGSGARLAGGVISLLNGGIIQGSGLVTSSIGTSNTGVIRASGGELDFSATSLIISAQTQVQVLAGSTINFLQGILTNSGSISLLGGTYENSGRTMSNGGTINGYGTLRTGGLTNNSGKLLSVGEGNMDVFGTVTNNGVIAIQSGRSAYFFNNVSGSGSFTGTGTAVFLASLSPGNSPAQVNFAGGATLGGGTALNMELGGNTVGSGYDKIDVEGQLSIGGALTVSLINGFSPAPWSTFDLLDWGTLSGTFSSLSLPTLAAGQWDTSQLYVNGTLSVVLAGDFNHDAVVNTADYVVWRKGLNTTYLPSDYDVWRAHYGQPGGSGSGSAVAVPEPATVVLLLSTVVVGILRRRTRCEK